MCTQPRGILGAKPLNLNLMEPLMPTHRTHLGQRNRDKCTIRMQPAKPRPQETAPNKQLVLFYKQTVRESETVAWFLSKDSDKSTCRRKPAPKPIILPAKKQQRSLGSE